MAIEPLNGGRSGTLWYYAAMVDALGEGWSHALLDDLASAVRALRADCGFEGS